MSGDIGRAEGLEEGEEEDEDVESEMCGEEVVVEVGEDKTMDEDVLEGFEGTGAEVGIGGQGDGGEGSGDEVEDGRDGAS